jgi:hypothetical protein
VTTFPHKSSGRKASFLFFVLMSAPNVYFVNSDRYWCIRFGTRLCPAHVQNVLDSRVSLSYNVLSFRARFVMKITIRSRSLNLLNVHMLALEGKVETYM